MNDLIKEKLSLLPDSPGSYQMRDKNGEIIYVGKAKNLKNRVRSYFHGKHNAKTTKLVSEIEDFTYVITSSDREAFLLEINLIKENHPKYNIALMDDKTYPYIALTNEENPRLIVVRDVKRKTKARFFGPYPDVKSARETCDLLNRIYPLRKCRTIKKDACIYYHMHQCLGPCINHEKFDYSQYRTKIIEFLDGDTKSIISELEKGMNDASLNMEFEKAIEYRDLINSINQTTTKQKITINDKTSRDYIGVFEDEDDISLNIIMTRLGAIVQNHQTIISKYDNDDELESYILQFYQANQTPTEIAGIGIDLKNISEILNINLIEPQLGRKKELLDMALYNAKFNLENARNVYKNQVLKKSETIDKLGELLGIDSPKRIEAFDNSNLFGEYPVSAMVCYINGKASPKDFRKYHVKTVKGANDYATMKEVVYRRYYRLLMENGVMPDLIVMDGGEIQVHACLEVINSLNLNIPVLGIQKDEHHKATILFFEEKFINIDKNSDIYLLLRDISQKVHDFAISFFRSTKAKGFFSSYLDGIEGLGEKRKEALIKKFVTIDRIKAATKEELNECGIPLNVCENIIKKLNEKEED